MDDTIADIRASLLNNNGRLSERRPTINRPYYHVNYNIQYIKK